MRATIGFRLTIWYSAIFIVSTVVVFGLAYFVLASSLKRQDRETIELKLKELAVTYQSSGVAALEAEIDLEKRLEKKTPFFIRLASPENKTLSLKIPYQWTAFSANELAEKPAGRFLQWYWLPLRDGQAALEVASVRLGNRYLLQVGKSTEDRENILRHFRTIFIGVIIPLIVVGFTGGSFLAFRVLQPIRSLINTIRAINIGQMQARVPSPRSADELGELVALFNGMLAKIETLIDSMRDSLDNVAHDLRTPMTRLRGIAEMALRSDNNLSECREALGDCLEESERILTMLNTLMDISEAETGVLKLEKRRIDAAGLIGEVCDVYRYVAEEKNISMNLKVTDRPGITADPGRMRQVLGNLLDNAVKYTAAGGRIDIEASRSRTEMVIRIRDTGIGVPPEELPRIWERLYRGDQSRSQRGLGLGLNLVKAIVEAHGGRIEVLSSPGRGSTFSVYLPLEDAAFS